MIEKLVDASCADFAAALAAKKSVPGGGGAAAMAGALGVALCSMAGQFTAGKEAYAAVEDDVQHMLADADRIRVRLLELVDEDAAAFAPLSQAYAIPLEDPARAEVLEACTNDALAAPLEMVHLTCEAIKKNKKMAETCARIIVSDAGCAAALCRSALQAAALNVYINTSALQDRTRAEEIEAEVDGLLEAYLPKAERIVESVTNGIRG